MAEDSGFRLHYQHGPAMGVVEVSGLAFAERADAALQEIAAHTGSSVAATYAQINHARKELRVLAEDDPYLRDFLSTTEERDG